jgi:hypothetical protein
MSDNASQEFKPIPSCGKKPERTAISTCWWNSILNSPWASSSTPGLKLYVNEILHGARDIVNRRTLKPLLREGILHDAVYAF